MTHHVLRWHASECRTLRDSGDTIDRHQRAVVALCLELAAAIGLPLHDSDLPDCARHHDEAEKVLGDWPGPAKARFPALAAAYAAHEAVVLREMGYGPWDLTDTEQLVLAVCDKLEAILWAKSCGVNGGEWPGEIGKLKRRAVPLGYAAEVWIDRKLGERR